MTIQETTFGPRQYLTLRKNISISQVADHAIYEEAGKILGAYMQLHQIKPAGPWTVLYFTWDPVVGQTEIGISFPIDHDISSIKDSDLELVKIPHTKAVSDIHIGPYENLGITHRALMKYVAEHGLKTSVPVLAVEEYTVDSVTESDSAKLRTTIYYLHD
jgi:effector-binding domain-containing protein